MKRLYFKCTLLSDIVLTSQSATEGFHKSLDYIPGSKFLGIVARNLYDENNPTQALDLFHNGSIKFGDAHPAIDGKYSLPTPFAWFRNKLKKDSDPIILFHDTAQMEVERENGNQMQQQRGGYISHDGSSILSMDQNFSIKSAYDRKTRKSKEAQMYGYHALPAGIEMLFTIDITGGKEYDELIIKAITGKKRVGRSRTAEYGLVEIEACQPFPSLARNPIQNDELICYALSDWCFYDDFGFLSTKLQVKDLGLPDGKINWTRSQVRYRKYQSYNSIRKWYNDDKFVIKKGSVLVVENITPNVKIDSLPEWIGSLNNEGLGRIAYNPLFLTYPYQALQIPEKANTSKKITSYFTEKEDSDDLVLKLIEHKKEVRNNDLKIEKEVELFFGNNKTKFKGTTKSQWGAIRGLAKSAATDEELNHLLFDEKEGFLKRGIAEEKWRGKVERLKEFAEKSDSKLTLQKLANKMQKFID